MVRPNDSHLALPDGQQIAVRDGLVIGRVAGCDIVIDDGKASRKHARLHVADGVVEVEDLGSSNGTLLNGKPVQRRMLRDGDAIQIGATVLVYRDGVASPASANAGGDDGVDLFGDEAPAPAAAPVPAPPAAAPPAAARPAARPPVAPPVAAAPPPRADVVEFADEVVEVRSSPPPAARDGARHAAAGGGISVQQKQRALQFHKVESRGGALSDDLAQMSGGKRLAIQVLVLAAAIGIAWALIAFVS